MFNVHSSEKEIAHHGVWPLDWEMLSGRLEEHMLEANGWGVQLSFEGKGQFSVGVHVVLVVFGFADAGWHWWVVRHLLRKVRPVFPNQLVGFSQNRVERLVESLVSAFVLSSAESWNQDQSLNRVWAIVSLHKQILVLHNFSYFLNHAEWLVVIDRHTELCDVFTYTVFKYLPNRGSIERIFQERQFVSSCMGCLGYWSDLVFYHKLDLFTFSCWLPHWFLFD